jgi:hypothetical protein
MEQNHYPKGVNQHLSRKMQPKVQQNVGSCIEIGFFFHQIETGDMVPVELTNYDNSIKKCNSAHMACICMNRDETGLTPKSFRIIYLILKWT